MKNIKNNKMKKTGLDCCVVVTASGKSGHSLLWPRLVTLDFNEHKQDSKSGLFICLFRFSVDQPCRAHQSLLNARILP